MPAMLCIHGYDVQMETCPDCPGLGGVQLSGQSARAQLAKLRALVAEQAEDPALWFRSRTAPEAYLQAALRRLHAAIEEGA